MWSVEDVSIKGQRQKRIGDKDSWGRCNCATCGAEVVKKHGIGGIEKRKKEEQRK